MDILIDLVLPLVLAFIAFSLGIGLKIADFARILRMPLAVTAGLAMQVLGLPLIAFALVRLFGLEGSMAFGVMLLAFCPGGVTSNMLTKLAGGTLALSITLTAIVSLFSFLTVPFFAALAGAEFLGEAGHAIDTTQLALKLFAITAVPVAIGVLINHFAPGFAARIDRPLGIVATALFVVIVIAALATNWDIFTGNLPSLGPVLITLNLVLLAVGFAAARLIGLSRPDGAAIAIELGVQNATLGIAVAGMISGAAGIGALGIASAVYGILMYLIMLPVVIGLRRLMG